MKLIYKWLLSVVCLLISFTLSSEQKAPVQLSPVEINLEDVDMDMDVDAIPDSDVLINGNPDKYSERELTYGPGIGCSVVILD